MDDIDARLRRAGEAWRDSLQVPLSDVPARSATVSRTDWSGGATVMLAIALVAAVAVPLAFRLVGPKSGAGESASAVAVGSLVTATGRIVATSGSPVLLCGLPEAADLSRGGEARCSAPSVELQGLDLAQVPGAAPVGDATVVNALTVQGTWTGTAIRVSSFKPASTGSNDLPAPLDCSALVSGEVSPPPASLESEAEYARLQAAVGSDPDLYAGEWVEALNGVTTVVVGTTGEVGSVSQHLRDLFPYSLCVLAVSHSMASLNAALAAVNAHADNGWVGQMAVERNAVVLRVAIVDTQVADFAASHPEVLVVPLVRS